MHVLCDCETIQEFSKSVIDLINVNIIIQRHKYVKCLDIWMKI